MKVLLTTLNSKYVHSNLALRYLYSVTFNNFDVSLKEFSINDEMFKILASIADENPDIITFSCYIWNISYIFEICKILKQINPKILTILGGPEVSYDPEELMILHDCIDFIIMGEAEESFPRLLKVLIENEGNFCDIGGIAYREEDKIKVHQPPSIVKDLSKIPSPFQGDLSEFENKIVYIESSRGCPYDCSYCLSSTTKGVRYFPLERVKDDLERLIDAKVKQVKFVDRTFNCNKERAMEIWKFLLNKNKETSFHFEIVAHLLDDDMIDFLLQVPEGYFQFEIGIQSTNMQTIEAINRKTDFTRVSNVVRRLREKNNIFLHLDLIAGLPYETYERFGISFDDVYNLNPHMLQLGFLKLLKGSKIREEKDVHKYKYMDKPPYEVLENKYISFNEIIKLKRIEEVLEIYKNSGRFEHALEFILKNFYQRPFSLFERLAEYWIKNKLFEKKLGSEEAYEVLMNFYLDNGWNKSEEFREILKLDYIINFPRGGIRKWQKRYTFKGMRGIVYNIVSNRNFINNYLPHFKDLPPENVLKKVHFEVFGFDITDKNLPPGPVLILFEHNLKSLNKAKYFKVDSKYYYHDEVIEIFS